MKPHEVKVCGLYRCKIETQAAFLVEVRRSGFGKIFAENSAGIQINLDQMRDCDMQPVTVRDIQLIKQ